MRAREADHQDFIERDGVRIWHEVHGNAETTILLVPGWALPLRAWKAQIAYLSRHFRVIAYDPRGTGRSDRPRGASAYALTEHVGDALAVLDAVGARTAVVMGKSRGAQTALMLAVDHRDRVDAIIAAAPMIPLSPWLPLDSTWANFEEPKLRRRQARSVVGSIAGLGQLARSRALRQFGARISLLEAADRCSRQSMTEDFDGFARWFVTQVVATDPHSTKQTDDLIGWLTATGSQSAADSFIAPCVRDTEAARALCKRVSCPVLVIHGDRDLTIPVDWGKQFAEVTGGSIMVVEGAGHLPGGRYPVVVNLAIREFVESLHGRDDQSTRDQSGVAR